jgi:hypothetical protein
MQYLHVWPVVEGHIGWAVGDRRCIAMKARAVEGAYAVGTIVEIAWRESKHEYGTIMSNRGHSQIPGTQIWKNPF